MQMQFAVGFISVEDNAHHVVMCSLWLFGKFGSFWNQFSRNFTLVFNIFH